MFKSSRLDKLTIDKGGKDESELFCRIDAELFDRKNKAGGTARVYHVTHPHVLTQASGYLKHISARAELKTVYFRGQRTLYDATVVPSLYRGTSTTDGRHRRDMDLKCYLAKCKTESEALSPVPEYAWEPLLQHYGINTRWVDVVDNIWIALWFACHRLKTAGSGGKFIHFERRNPANETAPWNAYAYVLLLESGLTQSSSEPGLFRDKYTEAIDLRIAVPSTFVRPHAQHGILVRRLTGHGRPASDYSDSVVGVIRVSLHDALDWLGDGYLATSHVLFPPPSYDGGYRNLLEYAPTPTVAPLGSISSVFP